jgi:aspartyl-tRNA(Asn)/glutamyl-tRNA(Gln) amidotransferase subunit B
MAQTLTGHPATVRFFEDVCRLVKDPVKASNFVVNEVLRGATIHGIRAAFSVTPEQVGELLGLVESGEISGKQAKEVFAALENTDKRPRAIVEERGMKVVSDAGAIEEVCARVIAAHPAQVASIRAGKKGVLGFLVGQVMKETKGSANPKLVTEILERLVGG